MGIQSWEQVSDSDSDSFEWENTLNRRAGKVAKTFSEILPNIFPSLEKKGSKMKIYREIAEASEFGKQDAQIECNWKNAGVRFVGKERANPVFMGTLTLIDAQDDKKKDFNLILLTQLRGSKLEIIDYRVLDEDTEFSGVDKWADQLLGGKKLTPE